MGDLVWGRLVRAVEPDTPLSTRSWLLRDRLESSLAAISAELAEQIGREVIDHDVRVGPYRFLRSELSLGTLDELGPAIFKGYFSKPHVTLHATQRSLGVCWEEPRPRTEQFWALVDGMAKRIIELARVQTLDWSVTVEGGRRTLSVTVEGGRRTLSAPLAPST